VKRWIVLAAAALIIGCADKPYEPTPTIYDASYTEQSADKTKVRVHREQQLAGSGLGKGCPLVLKVDSIAVAGLQQNQYVDLYLANGQHDLSVRFSCAITEWRKSLSIIADGQGQEIRVAQGSVGQYRMWRVK
jgi:hypothetical protein